MNVIEATVVSPTHLELETPVPAEPGQRVLVTITAPDSQPGEKLAELRAAYLAMTDEDRQAEMTWAEEGLQGQPPPAVEFSDDGDTSWWE
jgi:hypothetical protein